MIESNPQVGKIATLTMIRGLFAVNPLRAGYGNRDTDTEAYRALNIPPDRIYQYVPFNLSY
jgi:phosphatidate phosphatase PAH1